MLSVSVFRARPRLASSRHFTKREVKPITATAVDHVCIVAKDVDASILWYKSVLGMEHKFTDAAHFYPTCSESPAFMQQGSAKIAITPLDSQQLSSTFMKRRKYGEHFALAVSREEFSRAERELPALLKLHAPPGHSVDIEACDYGHQLSLFFSDIDENVVELTTWVDPASTQRLSK